jgi:hypothetical protein
MPETSPKANVRASIAGTPQANEALIVNQIPHTARISRQKAMTPPMFDGEPKLQAIEGTPLTYVVNSQTPIIAVEREAGYYAVDNGVWFAAPSLNGPWAVTSSVPAAIYAIPPSAPLHYVTYVRVYDASDADVRVGYTAGYYGTVVSEGVVVYGTGYSYAPWIGEYWIGAPQTYGFGANLMFAPVSGWTMGFGSGANDAPGWRWAIQPWWGPARRAFTEKR